MQKPTIEFSSDDAEWKYLSDETKEMFRKVSSEIDESTLLTRCKNAYDAFLKQGYVYSEISVKKMVRLRSFTDTYYTVRICYRISLPYIERAYETDDKDYNISYVAAIYTKLQNSIGAALRRNMTNDLEPHREEKRKENEAYEEQKKQERATTIARNDKLREEKAEKLTAENKFIRSWIGVRGSDRLKKAIELDFNYMNLFMQEFIEANFPNSIAKWNSEFSLSEYGDRTPTLDEMYEFERLQKEAEKVGEFQIKTRLTVIRGVPTDGNRVFAIEYNLRTADDLTYSFYYVLSDSPRDIEEDEED